MSFKKLITLLTASIIALSITYGQKHTKEILLPLLYRIFPRWILYPAIAQGEYAAVKTYAPVAEKFPKVESVKNDEKRHGDTVKGLLQ